MATAAAAADAYAENGFSPDVVADFVNEYYRASGVDSDFNTLFNTPTRSSLATMYNSSGELVYNRHNLETNSDTLTVNWNENGNAATMTKDQTDPFGTANNAWTLKDANLGGTGGVVISDVLTLSTNTSYVFSVYAKANGCNWLRISFEGFTSPPTDIVYFNLTDGSVGASHNSAYTISTEDIGGGWYRCAAAFSLTSDASGIIKFGLADADEGTLVDLDGNSSVILYGIQYEQAVAGQTTPLAYLETTGTAKYLPRRSAYTYNGTSWVNSGISIETEARTNLETYSNDPTQNWAEGATTLTLAQNATDPWGNANTAWTLVDDNSTGTGIVIIRDSTVTVSTSTTYCFSFYAKASGLDWVYLDFDNFTTPASNTQQFWDLTNGVTGTPDAGIDDAFIEDIGGGWYRCSCTITTDATDTSGDVGLGVAGADNTNSVDLDSTSSILIYGIQYEAGDTPSSYIPTNGATVARDADGSLDIPFAQTGYGDLTLADDGISVAMEGLITYADNGSILEATFADFEEGGGNHFRFRLDTDSTKTGSFRVEQDASASTDINFTSASDILTPGVNKSFNIAHRTEATTPEITTASGGASETAGTPGTTLPAITSVPFEVGEDYNGYYTTFRYWNDDIGDAGIASAST
jgi:hypothetical protein